MRTEQISYLNMIHRCSSLHKASEALHISTQALSLSVRTLEKELGFTILERSRTGVALTEAGQQLLNIGIQFLHQLEQLQQKQQEKYDAILTGSLDVMATNGVIETLFPSLISKLLSDYPDFRLRPIAREFNEILTTWNSEKNVELGFIYQLSIDGCLLTPYENSKFAFHPLLSGTYYCTVPDKYAIAHYKTISLSTMAKYPIILFTPTSNVLLKLFSNFQNPKIIFADSFTIYKQLLKDGTGLGMTFVGHHSDIPILSFPNLKFIPFKEHIDSDLGFLAEKNSILSPKAQYFINYLVEYIHTSFLTALTIN